MTPDPLAPLRRVLASLLWCLGLVLAIHLSWSLPRPPGMFFVTGCMGSAVMFIGRGANRRAVAAAAALPLFLLVASQVTLATAAMMPHTFDGALLSADGRLLGAHRFDLAHYIDSHHWAQRPIAVTYRILPVAFALVFVRVGRKVAVACALAGLACLPLYALVPGAGPAYLLAHGWPSAIPAGSDPAVAANAPRNAVPSLHAAWALLLYWYGARAGGWWRVGTAIFLVATLIATVGGGEHYFVDLVVAAPFACAALAAAERRPAVAAAALLGTVLWMLLIRVGALVQLPAMSVWALAIASTAASALAVRQVLAGRYAEAALVAPRLSA